MSERGLVLALQRFHEDPGFAERVAQDPHSTLELYDLDENECQTLINAAQSGDTSVMSQMAQQVGLDWGSEHLSGVGHLAEDGEDAYKPRRGLISEIVTTAESRLGHGESSTIEATTMADTSGGPGNPSVDAQGGMEADTGGGAAGPGALPGDGYEGVHPERVQGS